MDQEKAPGHLEARARRNGSFVEWGASAEMDVPIKSIATILRRVPRGKLSAGGGAFFDPKDDEQLFGTRSEAVHCLRRRAWTRRSL
jgi:hypothetical protein